MNDVDFRAYLVDELQARKERNARYSLRAFARDLEIPADQLSSILNGRYGLSLQRAKKLAIRLNLSDSEAATFCTLVEMKHGRSSAAKRAAKSKLSKLKNLSGTDFLSLDNFKVIADWYHFAILELSEICDGNFTTADAAQRLGISAAQAKAALRRLQRCGLLENRAGKLLPTQNQTFAPAGIVDRSKKRFLEQLGRKALLALYQQGHEEREFSSDIASFSKADLPEVKLVMRDTRRRFAAIALKKGKKDRIYCLNLQLFRLSQ